MVLRSARFAREISAIIFYNYCLNKICLRLTGIFEQSQKDDHAKSHRLCLCPPRERETYKAHLLNHPMTLQILYPLLFPQNLQNGITRSTDQLHCTSYLHQ